MGIKGLDAYVQREIKDSYKEINMLEEIEKYKGINQISPLVIINISTLCYHVQLDPKDLICGYQSHKIKLDFENFLSRLKNAGAKLEFVFKKAPSEDSDSMRRRLREYKTGCNIIKTIEKKIESFDELIRVYKKSNTFPYNPLIQVALIQSAEKFGLVHGFNELKGKPTIQQTNFAKEKGAAFIMGLDTYYFLVPGPWQIWCDSNLDMKAMTIRQLDPRKVLEHFNLKAEQIPLFATLLGDLKSSPGVNKKVLDHFGLLNRFQSAANFVCLLEGSSIDEMLQSVIAKISKKFDSSVINDFKKAIQEFEIDETVKPKVDADIQKLIDNDFLNFANEIFFNTPIFIDPTFLDLQKTDMKRFEKLALPLIRKTAGVLLMALNDKEPQKFILLDDNSFNEMRISILLPDYKDFSLQDLLTGEISNEVKILLLSWITDIKLSDLELPVIPEEYIVDSIILQYLINNKSLTLFESQCIMKTIVDSRNRQISTEVSIEYPKNISERAFRCSFLYSKMYLIFHSCLSSLGMKNYRTEFNFDGVYFQKIYMMNNENNNSDESFLSSNNAINTQSSNILLSDASQNRFNDNVSSSIVSSSNDLSTGDSPTIRSSESIISEMRNSIPNLSSEGSEFEFPARPSNPRLAAAYDKIIGMSCPKSIKLRRLMALDYDNRRMPSSAEEEIQQRPPKASKKNDNVPPSARNMDTAPNPDNISFQNLPPPIQSSVVSTPMSSEEIVSNIGSQPLSSNNAINTQSSNFLIPPVPPAASPPLPQRFQRPSDGNAHSNMAAPRRISQYIWTDSSDEHNQRPVNSTKNVGG